MRRGWLALAAGVLAACADPTAQAIEATTLRVGEATAKGGAPGVKLSVFTSDEACAGDPNVADNVEACRPYVDRASGTTHLAYQLTVEGNPIPLPLQPDALELFHDKSRVETQAEDGRVQIIPHGDSQTGQVYVLLIDGSGSMAIADDGPGTLTRMEKLRTALLSPDVVESFFAGGQNAVVPLVFRGGLPAPLGGQWLVQDREAYKALIRDQLQVGSGFTYLYQAVQYASSGLAEVPELRQVLGGRGTTIIALTDGFNNEDPRDTCGSNQPRLERLVAGLREIRSGKSGSAYRPDVYTVGLGVRAWRRFRLPDRWEKVDADKLCPGGYGTQVINNYVETMGVDNAALEWIAKAGSGRAFVSRDSRGLADAFIKAAQKRYMWFELRYRMDPFHLRRGYTTTIHLSSPYDATADVPIYPNAWLDGPPGDVQADGWPTRPTFRHSVAVLVGMLSLLISWNYLPAALFNVRRALFGLVDSGRRSKKTG